MDPSLQQPQLTFTKAAPSSAPKAFYLYSHHAAASLLVPALQAGFRAHKSILQFLPSSLASLDQILDQLHSPNCSGGMIHYSFGERLVDEVEYTSEAVEAIKHIDCVTKDDFGDLHGHNVTCRAITKLIQEHMPAIEGVALVLGTNEDSRAAIYALQQLGVLVLLWDPDVNKARQVAEDMECSPVGDLWELDTEPVKVVFSPLSSLSVPPSLLESKLRSDMLVLVSSEGADVLPEPKAAPEEVSTNSVLAVATLSKCHVVAPLDIAFEAALAAFQAFVSPVGLPTAVPAPSQEMARAVTGAAASPAFLAHLSHSIVKYAM